MTKLLFGKATRVRLIREHLQGREPVTPATAWQFIYEELLWIDISTGLAHLYESDKAQPGRPWYRRTVLFTDLLCKKFGNLTRYELRNRIDKLFRSIITEIQNDQIANNATEERIVRVLTDTQVPDQVIDQIVEAAESTMHGEAEENLTDEELVAEFTQIIITKTQVPPDQAEQLANTLVKRARFYFKVGNKRQNVLGEGFEDLLQILMISVAQLPAQRIIMRTRANKLPGFKSQSNRAREEAPDIAIVSDTHTHLLASVKWSIRHDRQKQFSDELNSYGELLDQAQRPQYVIITNEYDPGRLQFICTIEPHQGFQVDQVYHINPELLLDVLADHDRIDAIRELVSTGKIRSIEDFLNDVSSKYK